jgi:hypothetical protein
LGYFYWRDVVGILYLGYPGFVDRRLCVKEKKMCVGLGSPSPLSWPPASAGGVALARSGLCSSCSLLSAVLGAVLSAFFVCALWGLLCPFVVVVLGWLLLVCACCVLTLLVTLLMVALRSRLNSLLFPFERSVMFRLFVTGLLFVSALLSVAVAFAYSIWPLFLVSCLCMLCAYCTFTFED